MVCDGEGVTCSLQVYVLRICVFVCVCVRSWGSITCKELCFYHMSIANVYAFPQSTLSWRSLWSGVLAGPY